MGKQIEFFQAKEDEVEFLQMVADSGYLLVDGNGGKLNIKEAISSKELSLFITFNDSHISISNSGFLDAIISEVIQYSRGLKKENQLEKSRLWMENKYYDFSGTQKSKTKELTDMYKIFEKWVKKNYVKSDCCNYYIGQIAYAQFKEGDFNCKAGPRHIVTFS